MATAGTNITALAKPAVGVTAGPTWATDLNTSIDAVDGHDHSSNKGIRITPAAINISADLEYNQNSATELKNVIFDSTITASSTAYSLYQSSGNLYWRDGSGTAIQMTITGTVNSGAGSITGMADNRAAASYSDSAKTFHFFTDGTDGHYGKMSHADLLLYKFTDAGSADADYVTIAANAAVSGASGTIYVPSENGTFLTTNTSYATSAINVATSASNYPINLKPHGTGHVVIGNAGATGKLTSNGAYDLIIDTNSGTNAGNITLTDGSNGDIKFIPNGTGEIKIGSGSVSGKITSSGAFDLVLDTNSGTNAGNITLTDGANANITIVPNGTGRVGINQPSPSSTANPGTTPRAALDIKQAADDAESIRFTSSGNDSMFNFIFGSFSATNDASNMQFHVIGGSSDLPEHVMTMRAGSVGIATTAGALPATELEVNGTITSSALDVSNGNIANVGDIDCDSISIADAAVGLDIVFNGNTTLNKISLTDNLADALNINEGGTSYIKFITTNSSEQIVIGKNSTFASTTIADLGTVTTADINGGTWQGTIDGAWTAASQTCANLGIVTTADINGGTIDGATVGASSHTTGKFTTCDATTDFTIGGLVVTDGNIADTGTLAIVPVDGCTIALGPDAGDDFNIDGGKFVVEGDTGAVGIGEANPDEALEVNGRSMATDFKTGSGVANINGLVFNGTSDPSIIIAGVNRGVYLVNITEGYGLNGSAGYATTAIVHLAEHATNPVAELFELGKTSSDLEIRVSGANILAYTHANRTVSWVWIKLNSLA
jgi:hypothetical protein